MCKDTCNPAAHFSFTPDGDLIVSKKPTAHQSGYFRQIDNDTIMSIDGDKYRYAGEGKRAIKVRD